ncbi:MAG: UDP-N-acetylmuramoyl-L-alanine--D-glutamate ligase [Marinicaulis sp.]|nr:UDP-N-acetylmuramoyl-L-alanine--D-glutamate ligase [Marinicaulis sp.]
MILIPGFKKKAVGVFGLGVSGIATCEALVASGASVYTWDENAKAREKTTSTEYLSEHPKKWPWDELAAVVVSPGIPLTHPKPHAIVRKSETHNIPVIGDTQLFAMAINALPEAERPKVVMVTGSNGKSTTTMLIGHILKEAGEVVQVGGNIGEAVLSLSALKKGAIYVLEMSSFQLDLTRSLRANVAVFLNLSPDHIDRHGDLAGYFKAKKRIFLNQTAEDTAVICVDDDHTQELCTELIANGGRKVIPVSSQCTLGGGAYALDGKLYYNFDGKTSLAGDLAGAHGLRGPHNHQNAAAAFAVCAQFGVAPTMFIRGAERFESLAHRMEEVARIGKVLFVNDSKATNADAAARALNTFDHIYWIAGGRPKKDGVSSLVGAMASRLESVCKVYLIGEAAGEFEKELGAAVDCVQCGDLKTAVMRAKEDAAASDHTSPVVLLSPACASYDQFPNFIERGNSFREYASEMLQANGEAA